MSVAAVAEASSLTLVPGHKWAQGRTLSERVYSNLRLDRETGCLLWALAKDRDGYGQIQVDGRKQAVHRVVWEMEKGSIPEGFDIDHVHELGCRHRHCANIAHLEPVTRQENGRRRRGLRRSQGISVPATHCANNHEYTPGNTYINPQGIRHCRACTRAAVERYKSKKNTNRGSK